MNHSALIFLMAVLSMVYMGILISSANSLLKASPSSNDLINFKVLMMINSIQGKFTGMVFVLLGLIAYGLFRIFEWTLANDYLHLPFQDALIVMSILFGIGYFYTHSKMNTLFRQLESNTAPLVMDWKQRIQRCNKMNNSMFMLFCITMSAQIIGFGFSIH